MSLNRYIAKQFGKPTGFGGRLITAVMNRQNRPMYEATASLLNIADSDLALDIGCGNGYMLNLLARQGNAVFAGIDISETMIKSAITRNRRFVDAKRMTFSRQSADKMTFEDASFGKVYSVNTVYFWDDLDRTLSEIRRVLKPGGLFVNTLYTNKTLARFSHTRYGYKQYQPERLLEAAQNTGFEVNIIPILDGAAYSIVSKVSEL